MLLLNHLSTISIIIQSTKNILNQLHLFTEFTRQGFLLRGEPGSNKTQCANIAKLGTEISLRNQGNRTAHRSYPTPVATTAMGASVRLSNIRHLDDTHEFHNDCCRLSDLMHTNKMQFEKEVDKIQDQGGKHLGSGDYGSAYLLNGRVYKVTTDEIELEHAHKLKGKKTIVQTNPSSFKIFLA